MTFATLFTTLEARGVLPRAKDCKTALRLLANALGAPSWDACPVEAACREEARWGQALDAHFQQLQMQGRVISSGNRRNMRSNLRTVFKVAEAHGLLQAPLPPVLLTTPPRVAFASNARRLPTGPPIRTRRRTAATACPRRRGPPISRLAGGPTGRPVACGRRPCGAMCSAWRPIWAT